MKRKLLLVLFFAAISLSLVAYGFCAWSDRLRIGISVKTADSFQPEMPEEEITEPELRQRTDSDPTEMLPDPTEMPPDPTEMPPDPTEMPPDPTEVPPDPTEVLPEATEALSEPTETPQIPAVSSSETMGISEPQIYL